MRQREAKVGANGAATPWNEQQQRQRSAAGRWLDADEAAAALGFTPRTKRPPSCSAINAVLAGFILALPKMVILVGVRTSASAVRISSAHVVQPGVSGERSYDKLLGGLLADGLDERSCRSRYQSVMYRRRPGKQPSPYLVSKLRQQEALQRRCGPGTAAYSHALEQLRSGRSGGDTASQGCKYLVSISYRGLGNRILATASAFLYAVLTGRVLLVDPSNEMGELFCEPFPDTTWLLPPGFPLASYTNFSITTAESYGNMLRNNVIRTDVGDVPASQLPASQLPAFSYVHLDHDATEQDNFFFCDEDQRVLRNISWLVMRTDCYIAPGLFLVMGFQEELGRLFPEPDTLFHHIVRYLFHPNNHVWGLVTRYYDAYLATAQQRVGIQVRVFGSQPNSWELLEQIMKCTQKEKLLPELLAAADPASPAPSRKTKAVLVTSLKSWYYETLKGMYWEHATATGEAVSVHQPSHEEFQRFGARSHDAKAWAEIYLLSLTDALVTTAWSTFGYVAQGLGGLTPWVMYRQDNDTHVPDPPCGRDVSMEPCFHAPPFYDCRLKRGADTGKIVPQVQHCIDMSWGLKIIHRS
ncbi:Galactoside 2-alpha-L-fucosyltransferase [Dichanthelium oligosanthes]|uniref:Fucosyltransferase n=1 Tax=Dichanthelium oligosanthes TaxID=888268 RepID=A0A1E5URK9_9POAL|nr:Galactoside 2-alpha-L-fucosyltransferase [Dichanthelium oligosanthes]